MQFHYYGMHEIFFEYKFKAIEDFIINFLFKNDNQMKQKCFTMCFKILGFFVSI